MSDCPLTAPPASYYVYFRIRHEVDHDDARQRIRAMQLRITERTGVPSRLMSRLDDADTWMEVYEPVTDHLAFEAALQAEVDSAGFQSLIEPGSARHVERFTDIGRA